ncbi:MAG: peptide-methionine (R)-S-oxide reductase MsrB [Gammaproteobacteria bacterium]|nr:peptide-methionine (R)-S-oxide reductase MsrB [Gammaproteobacteria bacterium]
MNNKDDTSDRDWKAELTSEQYYVTRQCGTEPPFSGEYYNHKAEGTYRCVCCGAPLFASTQKYDSGSGWPSFWAPTDKSRVEERPDLSHGMKRTEIRCAACEAHLGHVFNDGPAPTGQRYCVNSLALRFTDKDR